MNFHNFDVSPHNLFLEAPGGAVRRLTEDLGEGGDVTERVEVAPGAYRLFCALPGHGAMRRTLTVSEP